MRPISWRVIYNEFRKTHPNIGKNIVHWYPSGHLEITIKLADGTVIIYDHLTNRSKVKPGVQKTVERKHFMGEMSWRKEFGERLRNIIRENGMTIVKFAEKLDISERALKYYLSGERTPSVYLVSRMAFVLNCSIGELTDFD